MKITIMVQPGPYTFQSVDTVFELVKAALDRGHEVAIFHYLDAVFNMNGKMVAPGDRNIGERMGELVSRGVFMRGCGACANYRGFKRKDCVEGTRLAGTAVLGEMIDTSERFLNFGF